MAATAKVHPALTETGPPRPTLLSDEITPFTVTEASATMMISPCPHIEVDVIAEPDSVMMLPLAESEMLPPRPPLQEPAVWFDVIFAPCAAAVDGILPVASTLIVAPIPLAVVTSPLMRPPPATVGRSMVRSPAMFKVRALPPGAAGTMMLPVPVMRSGSLIVKGPPWAASLAVLAASIRHSPGRKAALPPSMTQSSAA